MPNTPKVNRDAGYEKPEPIKQTRSKPAPAKPIKLATRDPRRKQG